MKKIALLITLIVSLTYASDGYRASLEMISSLGKCKSLKKVNYRSEDSYYFIAAKTYCENGSITVFGPDLSIKIVFRYDSESIKRTEILLNRSSYFNGRLLKSYATVFKVDEYGIIEDFKMEISDSEVDSIYKLIRNFRTSFRR